MTGLGFRCCSCGDYSADYDYDSVTEAMHDGWVRARGVWTCPDCAEGWQADQQDAYDDAWPTLTLAAGYGS